MQLQKDFVLSDSVLTWSCTEDAVPGFPGARRLRWREANTGTTAFHGVLAAVEPFPEGLLNPWIMLPGFLYGENRRVGAGAREAAFPRFDPAADRPARMTANSWNFAADRLSHTLVYT